MGIDLNSLTKTTITTDIGAMNVLIYGQPKVGKSTFAAQIPNALFLATEKGHNFLEIHKVDINKWEDVIEVGKSLITQKHSFKTLVVDIADYFYKHCERYVMEKHQVEHPSDLGFGKGFALVKDEFTRVVHKLNSLGVGLVFISHAKEKTIKTKTAEWTMMATSLGAGPEGVITGLCDLILYCYITEDNERVVRTKPTKYVLAGDRSKKLPDVMPMDYKQITTLLSTGKEIPNVADKVKQELKNKETTRQKEVTV